MAIYTKDANGVTTKVAGRGRPGKGVPSGGTAGQVLAKKTKNDFDTEWVEPGIDEVDLESDNVVGVLPVEKGGTGGTIWPSNPNLLINGDFRNPVNRNGKTEYIEPGYTIDRWRMLKTNMIVKVEDDGIILDNTSNSAQAYWGQPFEDISYLHQRNITISALVDNMLYSTTAIMDNNDSNWQCRIALPESAGTVFIAPTGEATGQSLPIVCVRMLANKRVKLQAIQLELGSVQTLAHQEGNIWVLNNPPPDYATELAKCVQYDPVTGARVGFAPISNNSYSHRNFYRGMNLGSEVTEVQKAAIQAGTFDGLFVGDYWDIRNVIYRIADMDYWYNCGDTAFTKHHLVIVPDGVLYNAKMDDSNITTGAYIGSVMYTTNLEQAKTTISNAFGDLLLTHKNIFGNAVTNGKTTGYTWVDSTVDLMNEIMVYGTTIFSVGNDGITIPAAYTIDNSQLALFKLNQRHIKTRQNYWLRDVVSAAAFALVHSNGRASYTDASYSHGVRPVFAIG